MKRLLVLAIVCCMIGNVKSQDKKLQFEAGPTLAIPVGNTDLGKLGGIGVEGVVRYKMTNSIDYFGQTGLFIFTSKKSIRGGASDPSTSHIPVLVGLRHISDKGFITGIGAGCGFYNSGHGYTQVGFDCSPQIGYSLKKIDLMAKFNGIVNREQYLGYFGFSCMFKL